MEELLKSAELSASEEPINQEGRSYFAPRLTTRALCNVCVLEGSSTWTDDPALGADSEFGDDFS